MCDGYHRPDVQKPVPWLWGSRAEQFKRRYKPGLPRRGARRKEMAHVITDSCAKDMLCLETCPNGSIRPGQDETLLAEVPQLYINPDECLDCGACIPVCPTNSIFPSEDLPADKAEYAAKNAEFFANHPA
jgi:ferredoxin